MAWPGNNFNSFWEAMYGPPPPPPPHGGPHGAGVDHAPPPPPPPPPFEAPPYMNPDFWNRWSQQRRPGWEDFGGPNEEGGPWGHGHHRGPGPRWGGRRGGPGGRGSGDEGPAHDSGSDDGNEAFPPEYISDDEVAAAAAAAELDNKKKGDGEKADASPDTTMRDETADPPEEVPNADEGDQHPRHRGGCRHGHGRRGHRGGPFGGRRGGPRGMHHHGHGPHHPPPPPPFGPFGPFDFGGMFGGGPSHRRSFGGGRHRGPHAHGHGPPFPPPPFPPNMFEAFFGGGSRGPPPPPPPPPGPGPHHRPRGPHPPPPPPPGHQGPEGGAGGPFDLRSLMAALANHPYAHQVREYLERAQQAQNNDNDSANERVFTPDGSEDGGEMDAGAFTPPLDVFEQPDRWVLHLAVPGAKKEDVGVNWDADRSVLSIGGVIHRPGDEAFLKGLVSGERSVGLFSREVRLPPPTGGGAAEKSREEVDSEGIAARMEDGILVVTVPKVEKDWTEVKRVEIE